ncbi:aspartyl-phosphate phosphatase Spo0E family protein [Priestia megaterium]
MTWYNGVIIYTLLMEIEIAKEIMIQFAFEEGFTSDNTVKTSQVIDDLLNELQRINIETQTCVSL